MSEYTEEETYEPSVVEEAQVRQRVEETLSKVSQDIGLRMQVADIATRVPFNPTEAVTPELFTSRCNAILDWVLNNSLDVENK